MDIFQYNRNEHLKKSPLADRMRPQTLEEFVGQEHILAPGRLLRRAIQADQLSSLLFYGPPGTGKTTLARIIANTTKAEFIAINAVLAGVKDIRASIETAEKALEEHGRKTILFVDEVHRFNKAQQDALLPHVENGTLTLIGATTENPYFEVNKALVSRSRIFQLQSLSEASMEDVLNMALKNKERGYGELNISVTDEAVSHLSQVASGDARALLNALELAVTTSQPNSDGSILINLAIAEESIQKRAVLYDKDGDAHFDTISAFIKSVRGSDVDAALYWMAKMVYAGEDPRFLFRRMIILASEDIGLADPNALSVVNSAAQAFDYVGMPEGRFHLAQACIYLATAPKSNSTFAFFDALNHVQEEAKDEVPNHLKDGSRDKKGFGHGEGYLYPHAYKDHWVSQQYLPKTLQGRIFYHPSKQGHEALISEQVEKNRETQLAHFIDNKSDSLNEDWQDRTMSDSGSTLDFVRSMFFEGLNFSQEPLILNLNGGNGLFAGEIIRQSRNCTLHVETTSNQEQTFIEHLFKKQGEPYTFFSVPHFDNTLKKLEQENIKFNYILGKNVLFSRNDKITYLQELQNIRTEKGVLSLLEPVPSQSQRISSLVKNLHPSFSYIPDLEYAEKLIYENTNNPKTNWNPETLREDLEKTGYKTTVYKEFQTSTGLFITPKRIQSWFSPSLNNDPSYQSILMESLDSTNYENLVKELSHLLEGKKIQWTSSWILFRAT